MTAKRSSVPSMASGMGLSWLMVEERKSEEWLRPALQAETPGLEGHLLDDSSP
jgi:hypothetical protein